MLSPPDVKSLLPWRALSGIDFFVLTLAFILTAYFLSNAMLLLTMSAFGHDEVHYYRDFTFKLRQDGRWLNFHIHDFLRSVPLNAWAGLLLSCSWIFFYRIGRRAGFDRAFSLLLAVTILLSYPNVEQSLWPATSFPAVMALLLMVYLSDRGLPYSLVYLLGGILIFGSMQNYYFLLPLIFLSTFLDFSLSSKERWQLLFKHLGFWIAGAILGFLVMSVMVWFKLGQFGIEPAGWRHVQPIESISDIWRNTVHIFNALSRQLNFISGITEIKRPLFWGLLVVAVLLRMRRLISLELCALCLLMAITLAFFAFSLPLAPVIESRSLISMGAGLVFLIAVLPGRHSAGRFLASVMVAVVGYGFALHANSYLTRHKLATELIQAKFLAAMPGNPDDYTALAVFGRMSKTSPQHWFFNDTPRMHGLIHAIGARQYYDCRTGADRRCDGLTDTNLIVRQPFAQGELTFSVSSEGVGILRYEE